MSSREKLIQESPSIRNCKKRHQLSSTTFTRKDRNFKEYPRVYNNDTWTFIDTPAFDRSRFSCPDRGGGVIIYISSGQYAYCEEIGCPYLDTSEVPENNDIHNLILERRYNGNLR